MFQNIEQLSWKFKINPILLFKIDYNIIYTAECVCHLIEIPTIAIIVHAIIITPRINKTI